MNGIDARRIDPTARDHISTRTLGIRDDAVSTTTREPHHSWEKGPFNPLVQLGKQDKRRVVESYYAPNRLASQRRCIVGRVKDIEAQLPGPTGEYRLFP